MANANLHAAKAAKNDEFYTQFDDIYSELDKYRKHFRDKVVYLPCDDTWSEFLKYFQLQFHFLGIKKVIATHYTKEGPSYKVEIVDGIVSDKIPLETNGDFRSPECMRLLAECDVVVTNPPFSLIREFIATLIASKKQFLFIGPKNAIGYKEVFPLIQNNELWLGCNLVNNFKTPSGEIGSAPGVWFTNLDHEIRNKEQNLFRELKDLDYPKYENCNAINVDKVVDIPKDFDGVMGVPITFLTKYNPTQFEIVGFRKGDDKKDLRFFKDGELKEPYSRILIKVKNK